MTPGLVQHARRWRQGRGILLLLALALPAGAAAQGTIVALDQGQLTLSIGARSGVETGMQGGVLKALRLQDATTNHLIARFEVVAVDELTCTARLTRLEAGWEVEQGLEVVFDRRLAGVARPVIGRVPPTPTPVPQRSSIPAARGSVPDVGAASERLRLAQVREQMRKHIDRGDWEGAVEWLQRLAAEDPEDPAVRQAIAEGRRAAKAAFLRADYLDAVAACNAVLAVLDDGTVRELRGRAQAALVDVRFGPQLAAAQKLVEALGEVQERAPGLPLPHAAMASLLERRTEVLRDVVGAMARADRAARGQLAELLRSVAAAAMLQVAGSTFLMGCTDGDFQCQEDEKPAHPRDVAPFLLDSTEVTVGQYRAFVAATGHAAPGAAGFDQDSSHPVVNVSWDDANDYCSWVGGRLPTEAEWELAARAGHAEWRYPWGKRLDRGRANSAGVEGRDRWERTSPAGSFPPNPWGLYDMAGNAWEWCSDAYTSDFQAGSEPVAGDRLRVLRGGSWLGEESYLRVSSRSWYPSTRRMFNIGFRCAHDVTAGGDGKDAR